MDMNSMLIDQIAEDTREIKKAVFYIAKCLETMIEQNTKAMSNQKEGE